MKNQVRRFYRRILPVPARQWLIRFFRYPYAGKVNLGDLRRTIPISRVWGMDRGMPVDRFYIGQFLSASAKDIGGHVMEVGSNTYTLRYGGDRVLESDILHVSVEDPQATIVADLTRADHIPSNLFDCIICTQTIHLIYEVEKAIETLLRILKPGGVLLLTVPGISQISRYDMDRWGDYWRFTSASVERLFGECFSQKNVQVEVYGNVLAATAFLHGLCVQDLVKEELDVRDPDYQVLIGVRAVKPGASE